MYLKSLTLHGFKSFAVKTFLDFPSQLIGIVGPNGSGKSNICDAIRWVLGEQSSKALRGERMDDVIFGGTSTAKPAEHAEVKLVFDNKSKYFKVDSDEVTLLRKIYRTGDSDYIINGENCRLKDIKELIMDTGLGRDAYSIIGQGMVDNIISSRGNERRVIIEEAAGIVKYKAKKNDALKKLNDTQGNIDRLSDLIIELERQITPISVQAQVAQRYLTLDEQLKMKQKKKFICDFDRFNREISLNRSMVNEYQKKRDESLQKITVFRAEIEAMSARVVTLNDKMAQIKKDNLDSITEQEGYANIEKELLTKISEINTKRSVYTKDIDNSRIKVETIEETNKMMEDEIKSLEASLNSLAESQKKAEDDLLTLTAKLQNSETTVNLSTDTAYDMINQLASAKNLLNKHESDLKFINDQIKKTNFDMNKLSERSREIESKIKKGATNNESGRGRIVELEKKILELNERLKKYQADEKKFVSDINTATAELMQSKTQYNMQDQIKKNMDHFKYGVKFILQMKQQQPDKLKAIHGVVADIIKVIPQYETAIEVALGGNMQSIIIEHSKDTEYCIDMLKRNKAGRVTFLPLNTVRPGATAVIPANLKGFIGLGSDLVKYNDKFKNIIDYLLGNVMIVDTLQHANEFVMSAGRFTGRIVTLGGELISSAGTITGGSLDKAPTGSHFGANTENTEMLKSRIVYLDDKIKQDNLKLDQLRYLIEAARREEEAAKIELTKLKAFLDVSSESHEDYEKTLKNAVAEMQALQDDLAGYQKQLAEIEKQIVDDRKQVAELEEKNKEHNETVQKSKSSSSKERRDREELISKMTNFKVDMASMTQKLNNMRKSLVANQEEIINIGKQMKGDEVNLATLDEMFRENNAKLTDIQNKLSDIKSRTSGIQAESEAIEKEQQNLNTQIRIKENLINTRTKQAEEALTKVHELDLQRTEFEISARNVLNKLEMDFKIREEEFAQFRDEHLNYEQNDQEIAETQRNIDMLGMVNLSAIEDYKALLGRINELKAQRDDLLSARDAIFKIIEEIDTKCTKLFKETFDKINQHISEIFQLLFDGGSAKLVLEDETRPLESGIDIKAQPPGKKLLSISLMSGGERALTALSLLFSILKVKPSPFCILDEVEAPLDEYNVLRFIKMVNSFKDKTQFLVITHNKQTMQHLELLYGVSMEEKGISKILSVRLEEAYNIVDSTQAAGGSSSQTAAA
ncbi:MAG: chromosome segregation protein SMC [Candidatus Wallbacteria bacterium]